MISAAVSGARTALGRPSSSRSRACSSSPLKIAEAASRVPAAAEQSARARAASTSGVRLRVTQNTRSSISTSRTSAFVSVSSTTLCARFETPST